MKIELAGATVCVLGRLKGWSKDSLEREMIQVGGAVITTPKAGCLVFLGLNPARAKVTKARSRQCTILERDDALALLEHGHVELGAPATRPLRELIGEARGALARGPGEEAFAELVALLDGCDPNHTADLVTYLEPHLSGWPLACCHTVSDRNIEARFTTGICGDAGGSLRSMPVDWVAGLLRDGPALKHRICDTLSLSGVEVTSAAAARIFAHDTLEHVRAFSLGETKSRHRKNKNFFKRMVTSTALANVETFVVHECAAEGMELLLDHPACLPGLHTLLLTWHTDYVTSGRLTHRGAELAATWGDQLRTFGISARRHVEWLSERRGALTALEHVVMMPSPIREHEQICAHLPHALEGVRKLTIGGGDTGRAESFLDALGRTPSASLREIDLSPVIDNWGIKAECFVRLVRAITESNLPDVLERVILNSAFDPALTARLMDAGVEVEVLALERRRRP